VSYYGRDKVWREIAHIYDNYITEAVYSFTEDDITGSSAAINQFSFSLPNTYSQINNFSETIAVIVPPGTDIASLNLTPVINYSGAMIEPAPESPVDFSGPVHYKVSAENGSVINYTVTVSDTITDTTVLAGYLASFNVNTADDPIPVKVSVNLANSWNSLLSALYSAGRYVDLDLSDSTGMTVFDPGTYNTGKDRIVSLTLPVTTTEIIERSGTSNPVFNYFSSLKGITGTNIETLGGLNSFYNCTSLETFDFPSLTSIESQTFYGCTGLANVTIGNCVTHIETSAFDHCTGLKSIDVSIANSTYSSLNGIVYDKDGTTLVLCPPGIIGTVTIPNGVTDIGDSAFYNCTGLTGITIPDSVTSIGQYAFSICTGLTSITIPLNVASIGSNAFGGIQNLTVTINTDKVQTTSANNWSNLFYNNTGLTVIFDGIIFIGDYAFYYCTGLTSVTIPDSAISIGSAAFSGCTGLTSVTIPDSVISIGDAFSNCTGLTNVTIGDGVTSIGLNTFYGCTELTSIDVSVTNSAYSSLNGIVYNKAGTNLVLSPQGIITVTIPDSVTSIGGAAFSGCTGLTSVTIPDSVISIGYSAFYNCTGLTSVTFEGNISSSLFSFSSPFPGDLRDKYFAAGGGPGTFSTSNPGTYAVWTKL